MTASSDARISHDLLSPVHSGAIVQAVLVALRGVFAQGRRAQEALAELLHANPGWSNDARARAAAWTLGTVVFKARLDYLAEGLLEPDATGRLAAYLVLEADAGVATVAGWTGVDAKALEALRARVDAGVRWPDEPRARMCVERSLPRCIVDAWCDAYGDAAADALAVCANTPGPVTLRAASPRVGRDALAKALAEEGVTTEPARYAPHALHVVGRANLWGTRAWKAALFEVQDEGSQLIAVAAAARPGDVVVDYCAGRGGKTLALLGAMSDEQSAHGELHALDVDAGRLQDLVGRVRRQVKAASQRRARGLGIVRVGTMDPLIQNELRGRADVVLVDAPCSELGTLRRAPDRRWRVTPDSLAAHAPVSLSLLSQAASLVRPGGRLVYATCTLRRDENEDVAAAVDGWPGFAPCGLDAAFGPERAEALGVRGHTLTLFPHAHGTDGFFIAAWRALA